MLWHEKHSKFIPHKFLRENAQKDIVLNVTEVAELLGKNEEDVTEIMRELHESDVIAYEDLS